MNNREDIFMEIKNISASVADVPFVNVFTVEETYFSKLPEIITSQINVGKEINSAKNLTVPEGYFENLAGNILNKIYALESDVAAELNEISPLIASIENKETFTVPDGYFNKLSFVEQKETAKVISINKTRSFFKYAAAAVITGLLGLGIVNIVNNNKAADPLITNANTATVSRTQDTPALNRSFEEALENISANEIEQYLRTNGLDVNAALVASSIEEVEKLPEATEYLLDENTLDNYLKEINLKN